MPVIIPPSLPEVPAIVRIAAHSTGTAITIQRPVIKMRPVEQPAGTVQAPEITPPLSPPAKAVPNAAPVQGMSRGIARPDGTVQGPEIVSPVPPPPVSTTPGAAIQQSAPSQPDVGRRGR